MIILITGILLILYCVTAKRFNVWVAMSFVLLIMGFQEGVPGDYMSYKLSYTLGGDLIGASYSTVKAAEFAQIWTTYVLSQYISFHLYVFLTSLVQVLAMGLMIKEFAARRYQYFGVLLIFFTFNIMLIQMKAMRQGYAIDCLLLGYYFLGKRKFLLSLVAVAVGFGFHNSAIVAIPFFLVLWVLLFVRGKEPEHANLPPVVNNVRSGLRAAAWMVVGLLAFYLFKFEVFDSYVNPFLANLDVFEYTGYLDQFEDHREISWWILLYHSVAVFCVTLYAVNEKDLYRKYLALLVIGALFLSVATFGFGSLMRLPAYFLIFCIVVFPNVAAMLRASYGKQMGAAFVVFNLAYVMYTTVRVMVSDDVANGAGFAPYTFSFLDW